MAFKTGLVLFLTHCVLLYATMGRDLGVWSEILLASIYLPLMLLQQLGVPVLGAAESWGWPAPTLLGYVLLVLFWLGSWMLVGYLITRVMLQIR
ncbi:hypothetical protein ABC502_04860 [Alkalimonas sp. NCh-2]|uniref:hypothetical protein n=1 Tax=Alkalimonas sp. NCh-2 TaxID=3144846 RepID=UPI0031F690C1